MYYLKIALLIFFQPQTGFDHIKKNRKKTPLFIPVILYFLVIAVKILSVYITHFPLAETDIEHINLFETVSTIVIPLMSLVGGVYLVTSIRDGETTFFETFTAIAFSLLPYIVLTVPLSVFSRMLTSSEAGLYNVIKWAILLWCAVLVIFSIGHLNDYNFGKTVANVLLSVFAVLFIWAVLILLYILGEKLVDFVKEVITEYSLMNNGY